MTAPVRRKIQFPRERLDRDALQVVFRLRRAGYEAYLVGGCVRDLLIGRRPKDFDVATEATPEEIRALFRRQCRIIGRRFRLAHVYFGQKIIETATFRANPLPEDLLNDIQAGGDPDAEEELGLEDSCQAVDVGPADELLIRRDNVFGTAEEDATRRDFTINGLFYDPVRKEILDYVNGLGDIREGVIRTIGNPEIRFREDPVRILRAIKFAARLGMHLEARTHDAMIRYREQIRYCPKARVLEEIRRILAQGASRQALELAHSLAVLETLLPEVARVLERSGVAGRVRRRLAAADEMARAGVEFTRPVLFGNLLVETLDEDWTETRDPSRYLDERLKPVLVRLGVPRKDVDRTKQILLAQRRLAGRRGRTKRLARADYLPEAVLLYELTIRSGLAPRPGNLPRWKLVLGWPARGLGPIPDRPNGASERARGGS